MPISARHGVNAKADEHPSRDYADERGQPRPIDASVCSVDSEALRWAWLETNQPEAKPLTRFGGARHCTGRARGGRRSTRTAAAAGTAKHGRGQ